MNEKHLSRKFLLAVASFFVVTVFAGYGLVVAAKEAADVALIIGAWGASDTAIFGFYNSANLKDKKNGAGS